MFGGMYGGGMYGNSLYGGGLGMGSSMYGGGLGGMGGMGGMYGGGMYGSSGLIGGSSYGISGGLNSFVQNSPHGSHSNYNRGGLNGLGSNADGAHNNSMQHPLNFQHHVDPSSQLASPIHQPATSLPPLNESPEEHSRRIQVEHKKERQLIRQQREQHRHARLQARMEIVGHLTNVLVQGLRSAMELFGVCFGTYYSMKAVRAFSNMQERVPGVGMSMGVNYPQGAAVAKTQAAVTRTSGAQQVATAATSGPSKWRTWLLCIAIFLLGEVVHGIASRQRAKPPQRRCRITGPEEDAYGNLISQDEYEGSICSSDDESRLTEEGRGEEEEEETLSEARGHTDNSNGVYGASQMARPSGANGTRRVYYALYDYQAPQTDGACLSFKAGDEFVVGNYAEGSWCEAMAVEGGNYSSHGRRGLVPSNFLRLAERITKL
ncbi:hypothetical protein, conserved [Leishmania tarentolae]|uniref:SH3 domain-containing protein n=1 Tax=Leishmania tarentolae TaxID=5689 RepID=A0A640KEN0_LEITA|nr:hypothetical protein, conserved [Leishmania tarentolae]